MLLVLVGVGLAVPEPMTLDVHLAARLPRHECPSAVEGRAGRPISATGASSWSRPTVAQNEGLAHDTLMKLLAAPVNQGWTAPSRLIARYRQIRARAGASVPIRLGAGAPSCLAPNLWMR
jgi:hypothetical protein